MRVEDTELCDGPQVGPAYPHGIEWGHEGMTLRDYFAAHCPQPLLGNMSMAAEAGMRYAYADAMLAERAK